jgi:hypothetical protein
MESSLYLADLEHDFNSIVSLGRILDILLFFKREREEENDAETHIKKKNCRRKKKKDPFQSYPLST